MQLNEIDRMQVMGPDDAPLFVPEDEHVSVPGIWVVDFFPPSLIDSLDHALRRNHWDNRPHSGGEPNMDTIRDSRRGSGPSWWKIADVPDPRSIGFFAKQHRDELPEEFDTVMLKGFPIGEGLTAVVAFFQLSPAGAAQLDHVWHADHGPSIPRRDGRLSFAEDHRWTAIRVTQESRQRLHALARDWMESKCPGAFGQEGQHQPLLDLLLLSKFDPSAGAKADKDTEDCMWALGQSASPTTCLTSQSLKGLLLEQAPQDRTTAIKDRTWALWGNRDVLISKDPDIREHRGTHDRALATYADRRVSDFFVRLGLTEFLELLRAGSATMRDTARMHHGKFGSRDLNRLRQRFLTAGLDFASIERDIRQHNARPRKDRREVRFTLDRTPWFREKAAATAMKPFEPILLNDDLRTKQIQTVTELVAFDRSYREVLGTVASLGASIDSYKVQRFAIWIAVGSAIVALVTLWITLIGPAETADMVRDWTRSLRP